MSIPKANRLTILRKILKIFFNFSEQLQKLSNFIIIYDQIEVLTQNREKKLETELWLFWQTLCSDSIV